MVERLGKGEYFGELSMTEGRRKKKLTGAVNQQPRTAQHS